MPSRKNFKQIPTPVEIQGEDAWVKIKEITVNEAEELQRLSADMDKELNPKRQELFEIYAKENNLNVSDLDDNQKTIAVLGSDIVDKAKSFFYDYYSNYVIEWNWVLENDEPMPQPHKKPDVFGTLTGKEFEYIQSLFKQDEQTEKK